MIKGIWWHIVVLLLAESVWVASCLNNNHRQKRQMRAPVYVQRLRNARYLHPIPVRMPHYYREQSEHITSAPKIEAEPWIPIDGASEAIPRKNIYVPPLRPPSIIVTRKPFKTSFNVPLTKSIQVSHSRPNIQTTGYIRKHRIKSPEPRTTPKPQPKTPGSLAEGTVNSLLNFTPLEEGWRPKVLTTPYPLVVPKNNLNQKIASNADERVNFSGVRVGEAIPVVKSVPENEAQFHIRRNKTNFATKFTPENVKISSEIKFEKAETPFNPSSSEGKYSVGNPGEHRTFTGELGKSPKILSNLWKEENYPYQGHKPPQQKIRVVNNGVTLDPYKDWKIIYDSVQNTRHLRTDFPKKDVAQSQKQGSYANDPYNAEIFNSAFRNTGSRNQNNGMFIKQKYSNQDANNVSAIAPNYHENNKSIHLEFSNLPNSGANQEIKSSFPYQRHATLIKKPSHPDSQHSSENIRNNRYQTQQIHRPSSKQIISPGLTEIVEKGSGRKHIYENNFKSSLSNTSLDSDVNHSFVNSQHSANDKNLRYNSISNVYKNNNTSEKEKHIIAEIPLAIGIQYNTSKSPNIHTASVFENRGKIDTLTNREKMKINTSNPKSQSFVPITNHNFSLLHRNQNIRLIGDDEKPEAYAFVPSPNLKEVELKNPPEHLEFGDEDFLKPIVPIHLHKISNTDKILNTFKFSARDRSGERSKPISTTSQEGDKILHKTSTEVPTSKVEYYDNSMLDVKTASKESEDNVYFQPVFPEASFNNHQTPSIQKFQNYNNDQSHQQIFGTSKGDTTKEKSSSDLSGKGDTSKIKSFSDLLGKKGTSKVESASDLLGKKFSKSDASREIPKINEDVIVIKNANYSPKDVKRNNIQGISSDMPRIITPPPVITMKYDPDEASILNTRDSTNRSDNYVIQRKPALLPENANRPRKPKITITTGMLAGILIAALIFLAFLTGSMVYAFHQWKFGRKKSDRQKKKLSRTPRFPPEYLDENFAGNTYIHNNIFLPTHQNLEDRSSTDPDTSSTAGDEVFQEPTSTSARVRRHPGVYRETREE